MSAFILVTGASGIAGLETTTALLAAGFRVRMADVIRPAFIPEGAEFTRCDTRTPGDCLDAVAGVDCVVHLAAWHCGHIPPVSDNTIWAVNTDGTFNILQACKHNNIRTFVYASSMAYGHGSVYSVTKVVGEEMCRGYHVQTGAAVAMLRYHDFVPKRYLDFGAKLLRNGVDVRDIAASNVAAVSAGMAGRYTIFSSVVHTDHGIPPVVLQKFPTYWEVWCEQVVPGSTELIDAYGIDIPAEVEQHDLSKMYALTGWKPTIGFPAFLTDLQLRHRRGDDVCNLWAPGRIPEAS